MWLLIGLAAITLAIVTIYFVTGEQSERTFLHFMAPPSAPKASCCPCSGSS